MNFDGHISVFFLLVSLLLGASVISLAGADTMTHSIERGQTFSFIESVEASEFVNGTEYNNDIQPISDEPVDIEVSSINVAKNQGPHLNSTETQINYTKSVRDYTYEGSSNINEWEDFIYFSLLFLSLSDWGYPDNPDFSVPPTAEETTEPGDRVTSSPYFATSNSSYYNQWLGGSGDTPPAGDDISEEELTQVDEANFEVSLGNDGMFSYDLSFKNVETNQTKTGMLARSSIKLDFAITVDVDRSLVTYFFLDLTARIEVGDGSKTTSIILEIIEGTPPKSLDSPLGLYLLPLLISGAIFAKYRTKLDHSP